MIKEDLKLYDKWATDLTIHHARVLARECLELLIEAELAMIDRAGMPCHYHTGEPIIDETVGAENPSTYIRIDGGDPLGMERRGWDAFHNLEDKTTQVNPHSAGNGSCKDWANGFSAAHRGEPRP
jgi:hypothetical protein